MNLGTLFQIMGGIGLFLYGIKLMGDALQDLAGDRMRTLVSSLTSTPIKGVLVGTLVTMVIQSSAATTIMTVSFVQAGMMSLRQALGVIMGANIGTTVTAQLVAFNVKQFALPLLGVGMALAVFGHSKRHQYIGNCIFGFGLLFMGMDTMEHALSFLADNKEFFLRFSQNRLLCVAAGTILTMVVQSSSATVVLTIAMSVQGLLPLESAIAILLGNNLGTTVTAVIASLGTSRAAKQAAAGHVLFNLFGVIVFLPLLTPYASLVETTSPSIARQLANAHTIFNIVNTLVQIPFVNALAHLIQILIPIHDDGTYKGARYLDERLLSTSPAAAVTAVRREIVEMGNMALDMFDLAKTGLVERDPEIPPRLEAAEDAVNDLSERIAAFSARLWQRHISAGLSALLEAYVSASYDIERIGDHTQNVKELQEYLTDHDAEFSPAAMGEVKQLFALVREVLAKSVEALASDRADVAFEVSHSLEPQTDDLEKELRHRHILRLNKGICAPEMGVLYTDLISNLERISDHATNLAEIVLSRAGYATGEAAEKAEKSLAGASPAQATQNHA